MPGSVEIGKPIIEAWVKSRQDIHRIVDFGPGMGTYPRLLGKGYHWIGVEVWAPYVERYQLPALYDELLIGDLREVTWPEADLLIFGDVLEHLPKPDALAVMERSRAWPHVIVSLPLGEWPQGAWEGNPHEAHLSSWTLEEARDAIQASFARSMTFHFEGRMAELGILIR